MPPGELAAAFALGVAGSVHCATMCGPIVLAFGAGGKGTGLAAHLAYHAGRSVTYAGLGALCGAFGRILMWGTWLPLAAGMLMIMTGALMAGFVPKQPLVRIGASGPISAISRRAGRLLLSPQPGKKFVMGMGMGFLPCGLLWAALTQALATGSAAGGATAMAAFGAGTAGTLVAIGVFSSRVRTRLRWRWLPAAAVMLLGMALMWRGAPAVIGPGLEAHVHHGH